MYKKILVPLDGSHLAECSLNHVTNLIKDASVSEVVLLTAVVVDLPWREMEDTTEGRIAPPFDYRALVDASVAKAKEYLAKVRARFSSWGIPIKTEAIESTAPSYTITDYAEKNDVDAIAIATHGYTGMKKVLLGSVASKVLQESNVAVLLIRPEACQLPR